MHVCISIVSEKVEVQYHQPMKHKPVAPGWRASRTSVAMCTCTRVGHYYIMQFKWSPAEFLCRFMNFDALVHLY